MPLTEKEQNPLQAAQIQPGSDLTGRDLRGTDLSQSDLTGVKVDAETLSRASGLEAVQGVEPYLKAEAMAIKPHIERLDDLESRLEKLGTETGVRGNLRYINRGGVKGEENHLKEEIAKAQQALQQTRDNLARMPLPGNQNDFEIKDSYTVGTEVTKRPDTPESIALKKFQASETFKVDSAVALDQRGATFAIGKAGVGYKTTRLATADAESPDTINSASKDLNILATAAHLYGKYNDVVTVSANNVVQEAQARTQVLGADTTTLLTRAIATSEVNKALGMDSVSEERFAIDEHGDPMTLSVAVPGAPILDRPSDPTKQEQYLNIRYEDHAIQKGLYDLEAQDYITGQIDRHTGNIFIDPNDGSVRGIDNDLAFPVVPREQMLQDQTNSAKAVANKPLFMHSDTADKIEAMSPDALRKTLESIPTPPGVAGLEPAAIDGTVQRLVELQDHIKDLRQQGRVVDQFTRENYTAAIEHQIANSPEGSLANRQNKSLPTSYLGAAAAEGEKTRLVNEHGKDYEKRIERLENTVPASTINPQFAAYQQAVAEAKQDILANPHQLQDSGLAQTITLRSQDVADFETKLAKDTEFMTKTQASLKAAIPGGDEIKIADLSDTLQRVQEMRQETLQHLNAARSDLDRALDRAVDGQKPQIAQAVRNGTLQLNQGQGQGQNQNQNQNQNSDWQRVGTQQAVNQDRKFNIGQRQNSNPDLGAAQSSPPTATTTSTTPARPNAGRPLPPIPGQEPKAVARPQRAGAGRPLPPIPGQEPKVEGAEVKAEAAEVDAPEKANSVKADLNADTETEKKDHSRKNSVGGDIKWQRPNKPDTSNEKSVKEGFLRK